MNFLEFPESVLDARTIWMFRKKLSSPGKDNKIREDIWKQFNEKGITLKRVAIQDATFLESDPGTGRRKKGDRNMHIDSVFPKKPAEQEKT